MENRLRLLSGAGFALLGTSISLSWHYSQLFPYLQVGFVGALAVVVVGHLLHEDPKRRYYWTLSHVIVIGVLYRASMVGIPATPIGYDPDKYALFARLTLLTGEYGVPVSFYERAGAFHTFVAESAAIMGVSPEVAIRITSVLYAVWFPALAAMLCFAVWGRTKPGYDAAALAAVLATVAAMGMRMSVWPIAQTLGLVVFVSGLAVVLRQHARRYRGDLLLLVILLAAMAVAHKLTLLAFSAIIALVWVAEGLVLRTPLVRTTRDRHLSTMLLFISGTVLVLQYVFLTDFLVGAIREILVTYESDFTLTRTGAEPAGAIVPDTGNLWPFYSHSYAFLTLAIGGIVWIAVAWRRVLRAESVNHRLIVFLTINATLAAMFVVSIGGAVGGGVHPFRIFSLGEVFLLALVALGFALLCADRSPTNGRRVFVTGIVLCLVVFHGFSATVAPDYPAQQREYLTEGEMKGKEFAADHLSTSVATDDKFARETHHPERVTDKHDPLVELGNAPRNQQFVTATIPLIDGTLFESDSPAVLFRTDATVYNPPSGLFENYRYELTWDVEESGDRSYHRVYDNGDVILYREP